MSKLSVAADTLRRIAVHYEGIVDAAKALDEFGSANDTLESTLKALEKAKSELALTNERLVTANKGYDAFIDKFEKEAAAIVLAARKQSEKLLAEADAEAKTIVADAIAVSAEKIAKGQAEIEKTQNAAQESLQESRNLLASVNLQVSEARKAQSVVLQSVTALREEEASIRERLKKIMGVS